MKWHILVGVGLGWVGRTVQHKLSKYRSYIQWKRRSSNIHVQELLDVSLNQGVFQRPIVVPFFAMSDNLSDANTRCLSWVPCHFNKIYQKQEKMLTYFWKVLEQMWQLVEIIWWIPCWMPVWWLACELKVYVLIMLLKRQHFHQCMSKSFPLCAPHSGVCQLSLPGAEVYNWKLMWGTNGG